MRSMESFSLLRLTPTANSIWSHSALPYPTLCYTTLPQHSTAQHSTARHGTAQPGPAEPTLHRIGVPSFVHLVTTVPQLFTILLTSGAKYKHYEINSIDRQSLSRCDAADFPPSLLRFRPAWTTTASPPASWSRTRRTRPDCQVVFGRAGLSGSLCREQLRPDVPRAGPCRSLPGHSAGRDWPGRG